MVFLGGDTIYLGNPEQYNLGKGIKAPFEHPLSEGQALSDKFYIISNLHQLHCIVSYHSIFSLRFLTYLFYRIRSESDTGIF